jgi:mono/diheme cytochrome c family protein
MRRLAAIAPALLAICTITNVALATDQQDFAQIERGRYLTDAGDCTSCHTASGGKPFAGGRPIETPFGNVLAPNITPDQATGIGAWSDDKFYHAMHDGVSGDEHLYPAMPYPYYTKVTRQDVLAIRAYLKTVEPVQNIVHPNQLLFPFDVRASMIGWNSLFFKPGEWQNHTDKSAEWNRGGYLVEGLGHCGACHTPKNALGADEDSRHLQGNVLQGWLAPELAGDARAATASWSADDIVEYLKTGANTHAVAAGPMAEAVANSTSRLTLDDLRAIAVYLKDQPAAKEVKPASRIAADDPRMQAGQAIYADQCAACHSKDGSGIARLFPALKGRASVQSDHPDTVIRMILEGARATSTRYEPTAPAMPGFHWKLSDDEVAAVATYIRNAWGNVAPAVSADDVKSARRATAERHD